MKQKLYFEPPSRLQLLEKLQHLLRFSDFLLLISGDRGAGKTTLLTQLLPEPDDSTLCCCFIKPRGELDQQSLLQLLIEQLPSHEQGGAGFADQLKVFHLQLKAMQAAGQKCLIIVDDAENLSREALALLFNLHQADAQLILMSEPAFSDVLLASEQVRQLEGRVHHVIMEPMSEEETSEYLQLCHPALSSLPEKKKRELIRLAEGMPGRIETLLAGGKVSSAQASKKATAFPLPPLHMAGIGLVLVAIIAASLWQFMPEETAEPAVVSSDERVSLPLAVPAADGNAATEVVLSKPDAPETEVASDETAASEQIKRDLAERLAQQEDKLKQQQVAAAPAPQPQQEAPSERSEPVAKEADKADLAQELREVVAKNTPPTVAEQGPGGTAQVVQPDSKKQAPVAASEPKATGGGLSTSESLLLSWPESSYTLQMLGARSKESALEFISSQPDSSLFYYFSTIYKGQPWHVVVYGQYPNRDVANASIRKLPAALQKVRPWARSLKGVQVDIRKK
ncbi:SPOR domain-containing protein [Neptuniibacter halophilus]|uniref:SPOR domain-containing protein n=1 Tax=Neptuniibacter halophilus TaxID=651666 RepID=UPI0025729FBE|nr:AAA family ATPase [Neptuniibacter halophilus]